MGRQTKNIAALLQRYWHSRVSQQSAIAKKLQKTRNFCFQSPRMTSEWCFGLGDSAAARIVGKFSKVGLWEKWGYRQKNVSDLGFELARIALYVFSFR